MSFSETVNWVISHSYLLVFLAMCLEGPITTAAAGFAAALGYFSWETVLFLSVMGDLVPDTAYYFTGYFGKMAVIRKMGHEARSGSSRIRKLEDLLERHYGKTVIILKFTPLLTVIGFMLVGYLKLSFRKFISLCSFITIPKSVVFLAIGYYFGHFYDVNRYLHNASIAIPLIAVSFILVYLAYQRVSSGIANRMNGS